MGNVLKDSTLRASARHEQKNLVKNIYVHKGLEPFASINEAYENRMLSSLMTYSKEEVDKIKTQTSIKEIEAIWLDKINYFYKQLVLYNNSDNVELAEQILKISDNYINNGTGDKITKISGIINYYMTPNYLDFSNVNQQNQGKRNNSAENIVESWYQGWEELFSGEGKDVFSKDLIMTQKDFNNLIKKYKIFVREIDNKIDNVNDELIKEELKQIFKYILERGYAYLSTIQKERNFKKEDNFIGKQKLNNYVGNKEDIKRKGSERNVHVTSKERHDSFKATISKTTMIAFGLLREKLTVNELKLKAKIDKESITWTTKSTGSKNIFVGSDRKTRVTDIEVGIPSLEIFEQNGKKQLKKGQNIQKFNISAKNYKEKTNITGSTAANLDNYAKSLRMNGVHPGIIKILEGKEIKYFLLNEQKWNSDGYFLNELTKIFSNLGLLVSFSLFMPEGYMKLGKKRKTIVSDRIDFLMINGLLVPSYLIIKDFVALYNDINKKLNISVSIKNNYQNKINLKKEQQSKEEKISYKKTKGKTNLYKKNYLQQTFEENRELFLATKITTHINAEYREKAVDKIIQARNNFEERLNKMIFKGGI